MWEMRNGYACNGKSEKWEIWETRTVRNVINEEWETWEACEMKSMKNEKWEIR